MKDLFNVNDIKLKNRTVSLGRGIKTKNILLQFNRPKGKNDKVEDYSESIFEGDRVKTSIIISKAAAVALFFLLREELSTEDLVEFKKVSGKAVVKN